jgi:hypothetical protein
MSMKEKSPKDMTLVELERAEFVEACADDSYGPRLRELREELLRRRIEPAT